MSFIWKDWNKADKTLLAAFAAFLMALATHLYCPGNRVAEGFLFCAEAALVGGIAYGTTNNGTTSHADDGSNI